MATAEKITQMVTAAAAIPRLGLPKYQWWSEALHGVAYSPGVIFGGDLPTATSFPMPINLGASFNMNLVYRVANIISTEARAFSNEGQAGLNFFTPNINIFRDPRWGRGQETPGEDPFLTSQYVYALVNGLQRGEDDRYLKLAANCKHFDAYDLENWNGTDRFHFDARVSDQDLVETYLPPFETCIRDARVASIMCSFNAINGVPSCANQFLLETIARESYHLNGFVVGDCGAVSRIMDAHHYTSTVEDTVAVALHAGTDLDCALIGPTANATVLMQGNYHGKAPYLLDPITGIESITTGKSINVKFSYGCSISGTDESGFASAIELARLADVVIFFGGINQSIESEGRDRTSIALPSIQLALLQQIEKVVRSAIHVIIMSGSSLDLSFIRDSTLYGSLIWMGYAGQAGGLAVAKVIFGQYNPGGRLPITIYPASAQQELYNRLMANGIEVYVITASHEELVRMVLCDRKYGYNVKPENIIGITTLLKNGTQMTTSRKQITDNTYNQKQNLNLKFTFHVWSPQTALVGKYGAILTYISQWKMPIFVTGDTPSSDGYMLFHAYNQQRGTLRLWVNRRDAYLTLIKQMQNQHAKEQKKNELPVTADKNWMYVTPNDLRPTNGCD
ncbi:unnamed protein product [Rotaria sordida]|uniref:Glycoside hydrolase family 3 protein n=1 Tax=Rotaria sordida TaxID=392033 RepID=A0A814J1W5_9BILA|nr:unnamed protein product [Rotaria sordida]